MSDRVTNLNCCFVIFFHWHIFQKEIQKYLERNPKIFCKISKKIWKKLLMSDRRRGSPSNKVELLFCNFWPLTNGCILPGLPSHTCIYSHHLVFRPSNSLFLGSCQKINSRKHPKLWKAHRRTFFDVLIPSLSCPQVQRALVVLSVLRERGKTPLYKSVN